LVVLVSLAAGVCAATPTKAPKKKAHKAIPQTVSSKPSRTKSTAAGAKSAKYKSAKSKSAKSKAVKTSRRSSQQAPTRERYQEIQQALVSKGYLQSEATGEWGPDSAEALKRFQGDQNLTPDGKLNSLSLIALGLGPKRLTAQTHAPNAPPEAPKTDIRK
jgi:peptidoglycan hydrolase-like protein with peptidoglycan-binding domain